MIPLLIATAMIQAQTPQAAGAQVPAPTKSVAAPTAGELITKMLALYNGAVSLTGTIRLTQVAGDRAIQTSTDLDFVRPNKLYIRQLQQGTDPKQALVTADGKIFAYDRPALVKYGPPRNIEPIKTPAGKLLDLSDIYLAAARSLVDKSSILDCAICSNSDIKVFVSRLVGHTLDRTFKVGDETRYAITGQWLVVPNQPPGALYEMDLTESGDFRKFILKMAVAVPNHPELQPVVVTSTWEADLKVDATPDNNVFRVVG